MKQSRLQLHNDTLADLGSAQSIPFPFNSTERLLAITVIDFTCRPLGKRVLLAASKKQCILKGAKATTEDRGWHPDNKLYS